jgi:phosphate transport system substrate-binding protein
VLKIYKKQLVHKQVKDLSIENNFSGTRGGFRKFCRGKIDINVTSCPISSV